MARVAGVAKGHTFRFRRLFFVTFFWRTKESKKREKDLEKEPTKQNELIKNLKSIT
jgi:hypothetical protein